MTSPAGAEGGPPEPTDLSTIELDETDLDAMVTAVAMFEAASSLSHPEFTRYITLEGQLESQLYDLSVAAAGQFEFDQARQMLDEVIELNQTLEATVNRELNNADVPNEYRTDLTNGREAAAAIILLCQGQRYQTDADERQCAGDMVGANNALRQAQGWFERLADSGTSHADFGALRAVLVETRTTFNDAVLALRAGRYDQAKEGFQETRVRFGLIHDELTDAPADLGATTVAAIETVLAEVGDQLVYTEVLNRFSEFFSQMNTGDYDEAVYSIREAVSRCEQWRKTSVSLALPPPAQNIRRMEGELFRGWQAWAEAELAIERAVWDECRQRVRDARNHWAASTDVAIRHRLLGVPAAPIESSSMEMLLHSTLRRCKKERELREQIDRLHGLRWQPAATVINQYAGGAMTQEPGDTFNFHGKVNAGAIGAQARVVADQIGDQTRLAALPDLRTLAEELADLREMMAQGARAQSERDAVEQIRQAEDVARRGDEHAVREHLKAAGRWALAVAQRLGLLAAETAIKASLPGA